MRIMLRKSPFTHQVPPPLLRAPGDASPEGLHILDELPDPQAVVVWNACRDVTLWACTPAARRSGLFREHASDTRLAYLAEAGFPPEADGPLSTLAALLAHPAQADASLVASASQRLSRWLEATGAPRSALSLAQAAALALLTDFGPALEAGETALRTGALVQAEGWLRRALVLARWAGEPGAVVRASVRLGEALERMGHPGAARRLFRRAVRFAKGYPPRSIARGEAHTALFRHAREAGEYVAARYHAGCALQCLPSPQRRRVMHEIAEMWAWQGDVTRAVALLRMLAPARESREGQLESWTLMAEAAAEAGLRKYYDRAWSEGQRLLAEMGPSAPAGLATRLAEAAALMLAVTLEGPSRMRRSRA